MPNNNKTVFSTRMTAWKSLTNGLYPPTFNTFQYKNSKGKVVTENISGYQMPRRRLAARKAKERAAREAKTNRNMTVTVHRNKANAAKALKTGRHPWAQKTIKYKNSKGDILTGRVEVYTYSETEAPPPGYEEYGPATAHYEGRRIFNANRNTGPALAYTPFTRN